MQHGDLKIFILTQEIISLKKTRNPHIIPLSGVRRKFPRVGKVSSQSCDVTNQL